MPASYFVTGATGAQGGAVARALLEAGQTVHALARDASAPAAAALVAAGARVFPGSFDEVAAMTAAASGCVGAFLNVTPVFTDPHGEERHARNVLEACRAAGTVEQVVQSSVSTVGAYVQGRLSGLDASNPMTAYFEGKLGVETAVQEWPGKHWAIVRPPRLLNSYVAPIAGFMFPTLKSEGVLATAIAPDLRQTATDPQDVGRVVRDIFLKHQLWERAMPMDGERLTMAEIVGAMNTALGDEKITLRVYSSEEAQGLVAQNPIIASELFINNNAAVFAEGTGPEGVPGFTPGSAVEYFRREEAALRAAL